MSQSKFAGANGVPRATKSNESTRSSTHPQDSTITLTNDDSYKKMTIKPNKYTWTDRLGDLTCGLFSRDKKLFTGRRRSHLGPEHHDGSSPWLVPVYVLSTRQDKDKHRLPMEAKCTIDTGNMQGNIVSRKFVEEVLEYPESAFCALTKEEEVGAIGITGHQLVPEAAIYLTWYHKKSGRVFRDMRFLISPNEHFDLIIGAGSIQRDRLLDVPNLMANTMTIDNFRKLETAQKVFDAVVSDLDGLVNENSTKIGKAERRHKNQEVKDLEVEQKRLETLRASFKKKGDEILKSKADPGPKREAMLKLMDDTYKPPKEPTPTDNPPKYEEKPSNPPKANDKPK